MSESFLLQLHYLILLFSQILKYLFQLVGPASLESTNGITSLILGTGTGVCGGVFRPPSYFM